MPRKGMRSLWFSMNPSFSSSSSTTPSSNLSSPSRYGFSPSRLSFSDTMLDRTLEMAGPIIKKWNPETCPVGAVRSLFHQNRREAKDFIKWVNNLQKAMHFVLTEEYGSEKLVQAQRLMEIAMKRLQKEFYQILSMNRAHLDPESISHRSSRASTRTSSVSGFELDLDDSESRFGDEFISEMEDASIIAMAELRLIAECMISAGYGKECVQIYVTIRKSIVDEGIYRLGVEKFSSSQIHKMKWEALEVRIKNWLAAVGAAVRTLFTGERILCDHVFSSSDSIKESCFSEISTEGAMILFGFPENVARNSKKLPEKLFRILDLYNGIALYWPEIDSIFSFTSSATVKSQAITSLNSLAEEARTAIENFEATIQKEPTKDPAAYAGIHSLTVNTMNHLSLISDYSNILPDIFHETPPITKNTVPESYLALTDGEDTTSSPVSVKFSWLILVLVCKLDAKSMHYKDISMSYLFLVNNLHYIIGKVQSCNLKYILGEEWLSKQEAKVKQFISKYEQLGWAHVIDSLPSDQTAVNSPEEYKDIFKKFNSAFGVAYKKQSSAIVADRILRDEIKDSITRKILTVYREFYDSYHRKIERRRNSASVVRYTPEDLETCLSALFLVHME